MNTGDLKKVSSCLQALLFFSHVKIHRLFYDCHVNPDKHIMCAYYIHTHVQELDKTT